MKVAVIGAGISGLSIARLLQEKAEVAIFEAADRPGGLIKCDIVDGNLFHRTGGHVFNTKRQDVLKWFWNQFDKDTEFSKAQRNASVAMQHGKMIPYPIENHVYHLDNIIQKAFIEDILSIAKSTQPLPFNFEEFLIHHFGPTLYNLYFKPYNYKVWRRDLTQVPLSWLEGKLPMPTLQEMIFNNINHVKEQTFVHSSFYYPNREGSQFIANRLAVDLTIRYNSYIATIQKNQSCWIVNKEPFDKVIFCGNIKQLHELIKNQLDISSFINEIKNLEYHGTTTVFCEIAANPFSWIYLPSADYDAHRIICTGNFAATNNCDNKLTGTIEFTDEIPKNEIIKNLLRMPFSPKYLTHHFEKFTYPIQNHSTRSMLSELKQKLEADGIYLLGRFAEWEYYNMDTAIGAAINLNEKKFSNS